eukprot:TRINITY_DN10632_c0_g1_i1.p1 TRINITY_DN10632_c0_g1~~TRINITY_DN10632_c0_g1_i1.p1  ORF type:complete len:468 (+),score=182.85 TRINITY_DN10632_c0_g1_i1:42-1445(+)
MRSFAVISALVGVSTALNVLPERARSGKLAALVPSWKVEEVESASEYTYHAPLDHESPTGETIPIRYWVDRSCVKSDKEATIFVHMGGEGAARAVGCDSSAKANNAAVLAVEHRFYGESLPDVSAPLSDAYLKYLSVEQNLADTDAILSQLKKELNATKAVAFGGSYSGGTCSWFRQKYPKSINGCVSLSGVIDTIFEFPEFDSRTRTAISSPDDSCAFDLANATLALERAFAAGKGDAVKTQFNAANMIGTKMGDSDFFYGVIDALSMIDQYGQKATLCKGLAKLGSNPTDEERIANIHDIIDEYYGKDFVKGCFYDSECLRTTVTAGGSGGVGEKQWRWQKCTQVAYLQSAPAHNSLRSTKYLTHPILVEQCSYIFGFSAADVRSMNAAFTANYYEKTVEETRDVFYINYSDDPWLEASPVTDLSPTLTACMVTCDGCGHCGSGAGHYATTCNAKADALVAKWLK